MRARRSAVVLLVTGATCLAGAAFPLFAATADPELGSGLGSYNLAANAPVLQARYDDPPNNCSASAAGPAACEGVLNESVSTLRNGPIGHALSSVGWPGSHGGNVGSLLIVAAGAPDSVTALNDPVRAENFSSSKDDTVTNNSVPGATMVATATATKVSASALIGSAQANALGSFGQISSSSSTTLTGPNSAEAVAHSQVQDITLGPLHINAIVSDAKATTDGRTAVPSGHTVVTGATVNGVPVTIDEHGVTVQTNNVAFPSQATDAVNSALAQAGMTIAVSTPIGKPEGASVVYNAGGLTVVWAPPAPPSLPPPAPGLPKGGVASLMIGGAQVAVDASEGYGGGGSSDGSTDTGGTSVDGTTGASTSVSGTLPMSSATSGVPTDLGSGFVPPPTVGGSAAPITAASAASSMTLPHGLSPWLGVLALVGATFVMAGLRRLPDRVLVAPASACPQGDLA